MRECWLGQFVSESGRVGDTYRGTFEEVTEALSRVDRCFRLLAHLKTCRDRYAARDYAVEFVKRDIRVMQQILDIRSTGTWDGALESIIICVCGDDFRIRVDQWRLTHRV